MQKKILAAIITLIIILVSAVAVWQFLPSSSPSPSPSSSPTSTPTSGSTPSPEARNIKIGLVAGYETAIGQDMDRAARLAVEEINNAGGVWVSEWNAHVNFTLVVADTQDDSSGKAVTPVSRAVTDDKVDLLIGGYSSSGTLADEMVAINNRVPYIITGASNQLVTRRGPQGNYGGLPAGDPLRVEDAEGMSYVFHYCTTTYHYSKTVVDFFAQHMKPLLDSTYPARQGNLSLAIIFRNDAFGKGVVAASEYWIQNQNLPITISTKVSVEPSETNFNTYLTSIKAAKPDAVYVVDNPDRTPEIVKSGQNVGLKTVYIAVENNEDPVFYTLIGKSGEGQLLESKFAPYAEPYLPLIGTYVTNYQNKYNIVPGMMGADTYDAFYIAKDAIERAGTVNKAAVRTAIEQTNMDQMLILTTTGKIQFSTGEDYHEISPVTFIEQLVWKSNINECRPVVVWVPPNVVGVGATIKQADFVLPPGYEPGSR